MLSWLHPPWCPVRGDPVRVEVSCPAARPSPRGPRDGHSQRRCCLSAPPTEEREREGTRDVSVPGSQTQTCMQSLLQLQSLKFKDCSHMHPSI